MNEGTHDDVRCVAGLVWILRLFALALPISIALAEPLGYLSIVAAAFVFLRFRNTRVFHWHPVCWPMLAFAVIAAMSAVYSIRPSVSAAKLPRLLLMGLVPVIGGLSFGRDSKLATSLAVWFIAGCALRAAYHLAYVLVRFRSETNPFDVGNMRDPQMYLAASLLLLGFAAYEPDRSHRRLAWWMLACVAMGLVLNFKRGAWGAALVAFLLVIVLARKWRWVVVVLLFAGMLWVLPWTRQRIEQSRQEFSIRFGGRYTLWSEVAPPMLRRFPQGIGYAASRHTDFLRYAPRVQPGLHHLHNNLLQIALELGWAGLATWIWWIGRCLWSAAKTYRQTCKISPVSAAVSLGVFGSLVGLLCNGVVEYNFGDSEILMLWYLLTGLIVGLERSQEPLARDGAEV